MTTTAKECPACNGAGVRREGGDREQTWKVCSAKEVRCTRCRGIGVVREAETLPPAPELRLARDADAIPLPRQKKKKRRSVSFTRERYAQLQALAVALGYVHTHGRCKGQGNLAGLLDAMVAKIAETHGVGLPEIGPDPGDRVLERVDRSDRRSVDQAVTGVRLW